MYTDVNSSNLNAMKHLFLLIILIGKMTAWNAVLQYLS